MGRPPRQYLGELTNVDGAGYSKAPHRGNKSTARTKQRSGYPGSYGQENRAPGKPQQPRQSSSRHSVAVPQLPEPKGSLACGFQTAQRLVAACSEDLRGLWAQSAAETNIEALVTDSFGSVEPPTGCQGRMHCALQKFGRMGPPRFAGALLRPPLLSPPLPPLLSPMEALPESTKTTMEEMLQRRHFTGVHAGGCVEHLVDLDLRDLAKAGSLLRSRHRESELCRPDAESVLRRLPASEREQVVLWLVQVCTLRNLPDSVLHSAVLLLDRFVAAVKEPLHLHRLHLRVLAILGITLKISGTNLGAASRPGDLKRLLLNLGQGVYNTKDIIEAEIEVLEVLCFDAAAQSPLDFLESLSLPYQAPAAVPALQPFGQGSPSSSSSSSNSDSASSPVLCLATFLLQLSLADSALLYRYPHVVLAAGALHVALWCTKASTGCSAALLIDVATALSEDSSQAS